MRARPRVAIVGAGFGGLAMALELRRRGLENFAIFERADRVGGVWRDNTYPDAACDAPSACYSFASSLNRVGRAMAGPAPGLPAMG